MRIAKAIHSEASHRTSPRDPRINNTEYPYISLYILLFLYLYHVWCPIDSLTILSAAVGCFKCPALEPPKGDQTDNVHELSHERNRNDITFTTKCL